MEELQSTEVLDKEILEDARKKAFQTLKKADNEVKDATLSWGQKTQSALADLRKKFAEKTKKDGGDIMGRLTQDKRRARAVKIESLLKQAVHDYLSSLDRERQLALLEKEGIKRIANVALEGESVWAADEICISSRALSDAEMDAVLSVLFKESGSQSTVRLSDNVLKKIKKEKGDVMFLSGGNFPALVINTAKVKITASIEDAAAFLLEDKRSELVSALLGQAALEDGV